MAVCLSTLSLCACLDDFIPDYPDYSVGVDVILPDGFSPDASDVTDIIADSADQGETCSRNCYDRVCGPDDCGGTCGDCPGGTVCSLDYSICLTEAVLLPDGSSCGRNAACQPQIVDPYNAGEYYDNPDWPRCMNHQCQGLLCENGICTRPCLVTNDSVVNGSGIQGSDRIEDNTSDSDCIPATGSVYQGDTMCVGRTTGWYGDVSGVCLPASSFMPCNPSDNCQGTERCSYVEIGSDMERRCFATIAGGAGFAEACGYDEVSGRNVVCESGLCLSAGCTAPCDTDSDCLTDGAVCDRGVCSGSGRPCVDSTDCSAWECGDAVQVDGLVVRACKPVTCDGDFDCPPDGYYCKPALGYDNNGDLMASGYCDRVVEGGAPVGTPCGDNPGGPVTVCRNENLCVDGFCSARCSNDLDCFIHGDSRCAVRQEVYSVGYLSVDYWVDVGYCQPTGYRPEGCRSDADCGERVCTPWVSTARDVREVMTTCMDPPDDGWPLGSRCGELAWDAVCRSRYCFGEDVDNAVSGWCSSLCSTDADCPASAASGSSFYRWVCEGLPVIGGDSPRTDDDLFASWCVPVDLSSSWDDCGQTRMCTDLTESCFPILRAGPGVSDERVDYRCVAGGDGAAAGTICDPFGDGSDCASGLCEPSAMSGIGFCSFTCGTDVDCLGFGELVTCQAVHRGFSSKGESLTADICRMTGECLVCDDDTDCPGSYACVNITGTYWSQDLRCVRTCVDDADCSDITGRACTDVSGAYTASGVQARACMTPACS